MLSSTRTYTYFSPPGLRELIESMSYKQGWRFALIYEKNRDESGGLIFEVISLTQDSIVPEAQIAVRHHFLVPLATYNRDTWAAWLFDRVIDVETHEAGEFFKIDNYREFAPHHGNGEDPYRIWHVGDHATAKKAAGDE